MSKTYILQKDLPGIKAGTEFRKIPNNDKPSHALSVKAYAPRGQWTPSIIESDMLDIDWFLPKEENEKQSTTIYGDLQQSVDAILALEKNMEKIFEVAKKATQTMKKEPEKESVTLETCYKDILRSETYILFDSTAKEGLISPSDKTLSCDSRALQLSAIIDCMAVADYVNGKNHWKPELGGESYHLFWSTSMRLVGVNDLSKCSIVHFKTKKGAEEARLILGTETIKTALGL